jgi:hypothetical protein
MTDQHQPDDFYPSDLDDRDPGEWRSIEAREADADSEASDDRWAGYAPVPSPFELAARVAAEHAEDATARRRLGIVTEARSTWPTRCSGCGGRLFTGNTSGRCASCNEEAERFDAVFGVWPVQATATPPAFPWELDRHVYEAPGMAAWRAEHVR